MVLSSLSSYGYFIALLRWSGILQICWIVALIFLNFDKEVGPKNKAKGLPQGVNQKIHVFFLPKRASAESESLLVFQQRSGTFEDDICAQLGVYLPAKNIINNYPHSQRWFMMFSSGLLIGNNR